MSVVGGKADVITGKADISSLKKCAGAQSASSGMEAAAICGMGSRPLPVSSLCGLVVARPGRGVPCRATFFAMRGRNVRLSSDFVCFTPESGHKIQSD